LSQLDEIERQTDRLADYPKLGRPGRVKGTRELVVNRTPFIVVYRIKGEIVQILRVLHGAQQ
jgi:toxin ParE1/3/4